MSDGTLSNRRILIVEDEYLLADELRAELQEVGATIIGPAANLADATAAIAAEDRIDCAILDANLGGEMVYPAADKLIERDVPVIFTTGYDTSVIPSRFGRIVKCGKPVNMKRIIEAIERELQK